LSYQGTEWARAIRGVNRGEKAALMQLGHRLDQRTNVARVTHPEFARDMGISTKQAGRLLRQLASPREGHPQGIVKLIGGGVGRGHVSMYSFVGFQCTRGDGLCLEKGTFSAVKGDILAGKVDIGGGPIRKEETSKQLQEEIQNITPDGALTFWLKFKDQLKTELPEDEWQLWLRPLLFLKELGSKHLLLALPPVNRILDAYKAKEPWLRNRLAPLGYYCSATKYPDEYTLDRACAMNPEWFEVRDRLLRRKKESQRATA
jgi:hypothetical protein